MKKKLLLLTALAVSLVAFAQQEQAESEANVVLPLKVAVLDFTTVDIKGYNFLEQPDFNVDIKAIKTLNSDDRRSINSIMQGIVAGMDAWGNRDIQIATTEWAIRQQEENYKRWNELYNKCVNGPTRPMIIGADYLAAYLSAKPAVFQCVDGKSLATAMSTATAEGLLPAESLGKAAMQTGVTHLICGIVSDLRSKEKSFKGYGIETKTKNYELDVILKVIELKSRSVVYGNVYTSTYREREPYSSEGVDNNIFENLLTSALKQAAADLYNHTSSDGDMSISMPGIKPVQTESNAGAQLGESGKISEKLFIAVAETEAKGGVGTAEVAGLSDLIEASLGDQHAVISRAALSAMLKEIGLESSSDMVSEEGRLARFGELKGVDLLLVPSVTKIGGKLVLSMTLVDVNSGEVKSQSGKLTVSNMDGIAVQIDNTLQKMGLGRTGNLNFSVAIVAPKSVDISIKQAHGESRESALPEYFSSDFVGRMEDMLIERDIEIFERENRAAALGEMAIASEPTAAPDQYTDVNQEKVAGYVIITTVTRFSLREEPPKKLISGTTKARKIRNFEGKVQVVRVKDNKLIASIPIAKELNENSIPAQTRRDWGPRDFDSYLIRSVIPELSDKITAAIAKEKDAITK